MCTEMGMILPSSPSCSLILFRSEPPTTPTLTWVLSFWRNWTMTGVTTWTHKHNNNSLTEAVASCQIGCHKSLNKSYFCITVLESDWWQGVTKQWCYKNSDVTKTHEHNDFFFTSFTQLYSLIKHMYVNICLACWILISLIILKKKA